jgi:hypothetical protein
MRIGDILYFSPHFRFEQLNLDDHIAIVNAFRDRVEGFYLGPASRALEAKDAFAAGLVCCAAIDLLSLISGKKTPQKWLCKNVPEFKNDDALAERFWIWFRHGLVHEGYIKRLGQFSLDWPEMLVTLGEVLIVNPVLLVNAVRSALHKYCDEISEPEAVSLTQRLRRCFKAEIEAAKS